MNFDVWERRYKPLPKPGPNDLGTDVWTWEQVRGQDPARVWSLVDGDNGAIYLSPGFRVVNCLKDYMVSAVPHDDTARDVLYFPA